MRKILKAGKILLIVLAVLLLVTYLFMQQAAFGKLPSGKRLERIQKSPHYKDNAFQNLETTPMMAPEASYTSLVWKFFNPGPLLEPTMALPIIKTDLKALPQDQPVMVWFGHSSYLLSIGGKNILVDPVFSQRPSPVQYAGSKSFMGTMAYTPADFPDLDLVIITHDHYDHLDYGTIQQLKAKTKLFCTALGVGTHLAYWGVDESRIREFDWWEGDTTVAPGISLTATPARHFSGRGFTRNKTLWASFVLKTGGKTIFVGGDSGYDASFKKIGDTFGPFDIAMVECGQYNAYWPYIHMMPEQTIQAAADLNTKVLLPVHWGKFRLAMHPWKEPIERAIKQAGKMNVKTTTPRIGEVILLNGTLPDTRWWEGYN